MKKYIQSFLSSLQFFTIIPVKSSGAFDHRMVAFFPLAGLIIGFILMSCDWGFSRIWQNEISSLLDVLVLALISGALHLDGVGDTADGLFSHRPRERKLEIMKDSRVGSMGLIAVFFILALKWAAIQNINENKMLFLLIIPSYARGSAIFGMKFLNYGRPEGGIANTLFQKNMSALSFSALFFPVALSIFLGWQALLLNCIFLLVVVFILIFYKKQMNCITGDMLGAMIEFTEMTLFLFAALTGEKL